MWIFLWAGRVESWVNSLVQSLQQYGFSPVWIHWWTWRSESCMKPLGQILHLKGLSLLCVSSGEWQTEAYNEIFFCIPYIHMVSVASFPIWWLVGPTVLGERTEFDPSCPENSPFSKYVAPSWGTSWEMELLSCFLLELLRLFWESLLCPLWVKTSLSGPFRSWGSWDLSILVSPCLPSDPSPISVWVVEPPVYLFQEWSLAGEYSVPSVIWMYLTHRRFRLPE